MMYLFSKIYKKLIKFVAYQNLILEKYDYDNNQNLQPVALLKKRCGTGIIFKGKSNCSSVFEIP